MARPTALKNVIGAHLEKILNSTVFKTSGSLRELLRFTVYETVEGRGPELKEYLIGAAVLRKASTFDPKADPIVRVQMHRLRERLDRYYDTEGRSDRLRIDIPKGTYTPLFRRKPASGIGECATTTPQRILVGRDQQLAELRAAFESATAGHGALFCLSGEPGIGKTAVVEAFLTELTGSTPGCYVARGRCSERLAGSEAYLPVLEALEALVHEGDESVGALMGRVAPDWYAQIARHTHDGSVEPIAADSPPASQERLKRQLVMFLREVAQQRPVVLFLDDLHWADPSTIDMLGYWGTRGGGERILVVTTYRPAELIESGQLFLRVKLELQGHGLCRDIAMPLLTCADVQEYLSRQFPAHTFPAALAVRIYEKTEGNPLFVADLIRFLHDRGVLAQRDAQWVMAGPLPAIQDELPESVRSMVQKKIGALTDPDRLVLSVAAVQGQEFDSAIVAAVAGMDAATAEDRLEALEHTHGVVRLIGDRTFPDATLSLRYAFVHILYQNALYTSLRPTRKVALSAAVADALVQRFGREQASIASELAVLCVAARHFERAAEYFLLAAQRAVSMSAYKEAAVLARRGLEAVTLQPASVERAHQELRLQTVLGPALMSAVGLGAPEVEATYVRARELCGEIGETPKLFPVFVGLFHYWLVRGHCKTALELAEQLFGVAQKSQDSALIMIAHGARGDVLWLMGEFASARTNFERAKVMYVREQHQSLAAVYLGFDVGVASRHALGLMCWLLGYRDQSLQYCNEAIAFARAISHPYSLVLAQIFSSMVHQQGGNVPATHQQAQAAITLATELEFQSWLPWARVLEGWALAHQGQPAEGIAQLRAGIENWKATGSVILQPYFLALLADAYVTNGRPLDALATLDEALAVTERTDERYFEAELYRLKGELQNDASAAEALFRRSIAIARRQAAKSFELRTALSIGRLYVQQGRKREGQHLVAEVYSWFTEGFDTPDLKEATAFFENV